MYRDIPAANLPPYHSRAGTRIGSASEGERLSALTCCPVQVARPK
jgi:hypothetical protein